MAFSPTNKSGFSLTEAILALGLFVLVVSGFIGAIIFGQQSTLIAGNRNKANFLAEEGLEAIRNMRDENFNNLTDGTWGLQLQASGQGSIWILSGSSDLTDNVYTRQIVISSPGPGIKDVTSTVTWQQTEQNAGTTSISARFYDWRPIFLHAHHLNVITNSITSG